jgi:outer membrane protein assembly complex protein YaeT
MSRRARFHFLSTFHLLLLTGAAVFAQAPQIITEVRIEQEGRPVDDRLITGLIETMPGEPLSMRDVRETITHLMSLNRFEDVQPFSEPAGAGVRVRWVLFPLHLVDRMEFRGTLGMDEGDIRRIIGERYGAAPSAGRADEVADAVRTLYRQRGYAQARIAPHIEETHNPDRATMVFDIQAGPRATIGTIDLEEIDATDRPVTSGPIALRIGAPYDEEVVTRELERYESTLRARGYYEARATQMVSFDPNGTARVSVTVDRGPRVTVAFAGDPLPEADRDRLVPVRSEASADEDLLEDANFAIEEYLRARGYRNAMSDYARMQRGEDLTITFTVTRGRRYVVNDVQVAGNTSIPTDDLLQLLRLKPGEPFVQSALDTGAAAIRDAYRTRGFARAAAQPAVTDLPSDGGAGEDQRVLVRVNITEGVRTVVSSVGFTGNTALTEAQLRAVMTSAPGRPYSEVELTQDRDRIDLEYRNRGYESVVVDPNASLAENGTRAEIRMSISEGPQILVDHVIIVGNQRTNTETIERELLLKPGQPLGYSALIESQQRLAALGLFRRIRIDPLAHGGEPRRDILVQVEEAPPTTIGYGGGVEGGTRLRPTGEGGTAEERFEFAPRGFFEVGRRNLWGKNRSVNLFTRVSLRSRDIVISSSGIRFPEPAAGSGYGFNEYRVYGTFREPRVFNSPVDLLVTGILDQAIRSSFNFITREVRAEAGMKLTRRYSAAGRYSFEHTKLFDERFTDADRPPLIDRLFPQVRISKFSMSLIRDTRDDLVDPNGGTFAILDNELAARAVGSEVGFVKTFAQTFGYYRLPVQRRTIAAFSARIGAAHGFRREVVRLAPGGQPVVGTDGRPIVDIVQDLPASERFFAGGDTTVRGFSLDRLGTDETISPTGFPKGGNGLVVLNAEMRVALFGGFGGAAFLDAGNVFADANAIDFTKLRAAAGFGLRYRSPVGPIRIDLGFKLDRRELAPGRLERRSILHISLGQAF